MNPSDSLKQDVCGTIDRARGRIVEIGEAIMDAPELGFKEHRTADRVRETLEGLGLELELSCEIHNHQSSYLVVMSIVTVTVTYCSS